VTIAFDPERWQTVKKNAQAWWDGTLGRPLIQVRLYDRPPGRAEPKLAHPPWKETFYDLSVTPEEIVDRWDYDLSCREFLGDSFPWVFPDLGPGVLAAFMGARTQQATGTVWFHPNEDREAKDIRFSMDLNNAWLRRVKDICRAAQARWEGLVQISMTDLGGNLDVLSTFRPNEKLLLDLVDCPEEVKRLTGEEHAIWWKAFEAIDAVLRPCNPGYTAWAPIFSETPFYMLQCDFCYMIGPKMFDEFVKPELEATCQKLDHAFYHLDGVGELPHLDSLLSIDALKGVQWVPGAGNPQFKDWSEVYRKIIRAGKRAQVGLHCDWREFDRLVDKAGGAENMIMICEASSAERPEVEAFLKRYGAL